MSLPMGLAFQSFDSTTDLAAQRELFRDCFPESINQPAETLGHYRWKFHSAPGNPNSYEYSALLDGELVGYYAAVPFRYRTKDSTLTAGMVCDVMTGTKARGKGVFTKLGTYSTECMREAGLDFVIGYPIRPEVLPGHLKIGWKVVQRMPIYVKVLRTNAILHSRGLNCLAPMANLAVGLLTRLVALPSSGDYTVTDLSVDDLLSGNWYRQFFDGWAASVPNALVKDATFLHWRLGAPGTTYRLFCARSASGEPVGVCISRVANLDGIPALALLDIMVLPGHARAFRAINSALTRFATERNCEVIATMISPDWARNLRLTSLLYIKSPHVFSLIVKRLNSSLSEDTLLAPARWHTMWIDSDAL